MKKGFCYRCGAPLEFVEKVFRQDACPSCDADVRCCLNCAEYDESAPDQCREPQIEKVTVKDRANFCEYFTLREGEPPTRRVDKAAEAKRKLEQLFKK
jgi:hypothetical protein